MGLPSLVWIRFDCAGHKQARNIELRDNPKLTGQVQDFQALFLTARVVLGGLRRLMDLETSTRPTPALLTIHRIDFLDLEALAISCEWSEL
jgi:hypothetical protein